MLEGRVVEGFGRGSTQMGVPTANIEPGPLKDKLEGLPLGVYFGCAPSPASPVTSEAAGQCCVNAMTPQGLSRKPFS